MEPGGRFGMDYFLNSVALSGINDGWAVGNGGAILRLAGGTWSKFTAQRGSPLVLWQ